MSKISLRKIRLLKKKLKSLISWLFSLLSLFQMMINKNKHHKTAYKANSKNLQLNN